MSWAVALLAGLFVVAWLGGLLLPSEARVATTVTTVPVPPSAMFPYFNSREGQQQMWIESARQDDRVEPMTLTDLGGPPDGVGTRLCFCPGARRGKSLVGFASSFASGIGTIVVSEPPSRVIIDIDWGFMDARRSIELKELDVRRTRVTWTETFIIRVPLFRYVPYLLKPLDFTAVIDAAARSAQGSRQAAARAGWPPRPSARARQQRV